LLVVVTAAEETVRVEVVVFDVLESDRLDSVGELTAAVGSVLVGVGLVVEAGDVAPSSVDPGLGVVVLVVVAARVVVVIAVEPVVVVVVVVLVPVGPDTGPTTGESVVMLELPSDAVTSHMKY